MLANILYSYRGMGLSVGTMIAGWDEKVTGGTYHAIDLHPLDVSNALALWCRVLACIMWTVKEEG